MLYRYLSITILLITFSSNLQSASVPPPPKLSENLFIGQWNYGWGTNCFGQIEFRSDGTYTDRYDDKALGIGHWWIDRSLLVITRRVMWLDGTISALEEHVISIHPISMKGYLVDCRSVPFYLISKLIPTIRK